MELLVAGNSRNATGCFALLLFLISCFRAASGPLENSLHALLLTGLHINSIMSLIWINFPFLWQVFPVHFTQHSGSDPIDHFDGVIAHFHHHYRITIGGRVSHPYTCVVGWWSLAAVM